MIDLIDRLKNGRCAILGYGKVGRSFEKLLRRLNISFDILDEYRSDNNKIKVVQLSEDSLRDYDCLLVSPGIPPNKLCGFNNRIVSEIDLFLKLKSLDSKVIAVTGTNGKSTVCAILEKTLLNAGKRAIACGNFGRPVLESLEDGIEYYIVEVSSFQIYYSKNFIPDITILTNLSEDHLDWHGSKEEYFKTKLGLIYLTLENHGTVITTEDIAKRYDIKSEGLYAVDPEKMDPQVSEELQKMIHRENLAICKAAADILGIDRKIFYKTVNTYRPLEYRMKIYRIRDRIIINDSKSTNIHSTIEAINSCNTPFVLILGGKDKGLSVDNLIEVLRSKCCRIFCYGEAGMRFSKDFQRKGLECRFIEDFAACVKEAFKNTEKGWSLLFSPGSSSFDQHKNFLERGAEFDRILQT